MDRSVAFRREGPPVTPTSLPAVVESATRSILPAAATVQGDVSRRIAHQIEGAGSPPAPFSSLTVSVGAEGARRELFHASARPSGPGRPRHIRSAIIRSSSLYGPQQPSVKHTASGPQSALLMHTIPVHTSWTHAGVPSTVDTQAHPAVPAAQVCRQPVVPVHVSPAHVGIQNDRGATQAPLGSQTVPAAQQVVPVGPGQQLVFEAQHTEPVGPEHTLLTFPPHRLHACRQEACAGPLMKAFFPQ
jgi:hypothetical protein